MKIKRIIEPVKMIDRTFLDELKEFVKQVEITIYNNTEKQKDPQIELEEVQGDV